MSGCLFLRYTFGKFADSVGHAAFNMLTAFSCELELKTGEHFLHDKGCISIFCKFKQSIHGFRANFRLTVTQESDVEW